MSKTFTIMSREELIKLGEQIEDPEASNFSSSIEETEGNWYPLSYILDMDIPCEENDSERFSSDLIIWDDEDRVFMIGYIDFNLNKLITYGGTVYHLNKANPYIYFCLLNKPC